MGKTPVPLRILLVGLEKGPVFEALEAKGHRVDQEINGPSGFVYDDLEEYDLIFGPRCWRLTERNAKSVELALKEARAYAKATRPKKKASHT